MKRNQFNKTVALDWAKKATEFDGDLCLAISVHPTKDEICLHSHSDTKPETICKVLQKTIETIKEKHKLL